MRACLSAAAGHVKHLHPPGSIPLAMYVNIVLFGRYSVQGVLNDPEWASLARDLDVVELWSGVESVVQAARRKGYRAAPFDLNRIPGTTDVAGPFTEDITSEVGFKAALCLVLRVRESGLVGMAPVCSSWVFANTANTKRNRDNYEGNEDYPAVRQGNQMAQTAAFLMSVALARDVHVYIENPAGSMLFSYLRPMLGMYENLHYSTADRCAYSREPFGKRCKKPYKFLSSGPWLGPSLLPCACPSRTHLQLMMTDGKGHVTGNLPLMQMSASYPAALGRAIIRAWEGAGPVQMSRVLVRRVQVLKRAAKECSAVEDPWRH